ncbi:MAG: RNA polymerase sigma factor [Alcanivoracaceae bacterium]|nr:RNA polymerase sigma factor [Alcanivoracaceae bacterium]
MSLSKAKINKIFAQHHQLVVKAVAVLRPEVNGITAEDVEQEVSIRLLKLIKNDREIDNLSSYIYRITANVIIDLARKNQKYTNETTIPDEKDEEDYRPGLVSESLKPEQHLANETLMKRVLEVIETLPESRRIAIKLRLQGFSVKEMSEMTGWPFYKAENLSKRAMTALKAKLKDLGIEYEIN